MFTYIVKRNIFPILIFGNEKIKTCNFDMSCKSVFKHAYSQAYTYKDF